MPIGLIHIWLKYSNFNSSNLRKRILDAPRCRAARFTLQLDVAILQLYSVDGSSVDGGCRCCSFNLTSTQTLQLITQQGLVQVSLNEKIKGVLIISSLLIVPGKKEYFKRLCVRRCVSANFKLWLILPRSRGMTTIDHSQSPQKT